MVEPRVVVHPNTNLSPRRPTRLSTARAIFEQTIQRNAAHGFDSNILVLSSSSDHTGTRRKVMPKPKRFPVRCTTIDNPAPAPAPAFQVARGRGKDSALLVSQVIKEEQATKECLLPIETSVKVSKLVVEDDTESLTLTEAETEQSSSLKNSQGETSVNEVDHVGIHNSDNVVENDANANEETTTSKGKPPQHENQSQQQSPQQEVQSQSTAGKTPLRFNKEQPKAESTRQDGDNAEPHQSSAQSTAQEIDQPRTMLDETSTPTNSDEQQRKQEQQPAAASATANNNNNTKVVATAARRIQRVSRQFSNKNKVRRERQLQELKKLQEKREREIARLERIKQGRAIQSIRNSLSVFEQTIEKNMHEFGFEYASEVPQKWKQRHTLQQQQQQHQQSHQNEQQQQQQPLRRQTVGAKEVERSVAANAEHIRQLDSCTEQENEEKGEIDVGEEEEEVLVAMGAGELSEQSIWIGQLQQRRRDFHEGAQTEQSQDQPSIAESSTLLEPIQQPPGMESHESSISTLASIDPPIPRIIEFGPEDMVNSQISLQSRWVSHSVKKQESLRNLNETAKSRWDSQPLNSPKKARPVVNEPQRIYFPRDPPSYMKQDENSRWAIHPRVVYGKPKTEKAVNPPPTTPGAPVRPTLKSATKESRWASERQLSSSPCKPSPAHRKADDSNNRWAASTTKKKKIFPQNVSRWAAQPKQNGTITNGAKPSDKVSPWKPQRQGTSEDIPIRALRTQRKPQQDDADVDIPVKPVATQTLPQRHPTNEEVPAKKPMPTQAIPQRQPTQEEVPAKKPTPTQAIPQRQPTQEEVPAKPVPTQTIPQRQPTQEEVPAKTTATMTIPQRRPTKEDVVPVATLTKPQRQSTKEDFLPGTSPQPRRRRRRRSIGTMESTNADTVLSPEDQELVNAHVQAIVTESNSMPTVERNASGEGSDIDAGADVKNSKPSLRPRLQRPRKTKIPSRSLSLGEVKRIVSATRIQSVMRMYFQRFNYKMAVQEQRKFELDRETAKEIQHIRDCLQLRQQSLREKMERETNLGLLITATAPDTSDDDSDEDLEKSLRKQIAALEASNQKLQSQCDRLKSSNGRMERGNKVRQTAIKEVSSRLKKLQHIQTKLSKVYKEFQGEYATIQSELEETNCNLRREYKLQESTKVCLRNIVKLVRSKLKEVNAELVEELEESVPLDCLM